MPGPELQEATEKSTNPWQTVDSIAQRTGSPAFELLSLYRFPNAVNTKGNRIAALYRMAFNHPGSTMMFDYFEVEAKAPFFRAGGFLNGATAPEQVDLLRIYRAHLQQKENYIGEIVRTSPPIQDMLATLNTGSDTSSTQHRKPTYQEAANIARQEMMRVYGEDFEAQMQGDHQLKAEYYRKLSWYQEATTSKTVRADFSETKRKVGQTYATQSLQFLKDLVTTGVQVRYSVGQEHNSSDLLREADLKAMAITLTESGKEPQLSLKGEPLNLIDRMQSQRGVFEPFMLTNPLNTYIRYKGHMGPEMVKKLFELKIRSYLLELLHNYYTSLPVTGEIPSLQAPLSVIGRDTIPIFMRCIQTTPSFLLRGNLTSQLEHASDNVDRGQIPTLADLAPFFSGDSEIFGKAELANFIKWRHILAANPAHPLREIIPISESSSERLGKVASALETAMALPGLLKTAFQERTTPHEISQISERGSLTSILCDVAKLFVDPDFCVSGNPWKHMRTLGRIDELSTYPAVPDLPFRSYEIPPAQSFNDQIFIRSLKRVPALPDPDSQLTSRIFATEYARLTSLELKNGKNKLIIEEDYKIEYEGQTGHYRIVFTDRGREKGLDHLSYIAGIDDTQLADNAPPLIGYEFLNIPQTNQVIEFSASLREQGFDKIADNLAQVVSERMKQHEPLTTFDLEVALKRGSVYTFGLGSDPIQGGRAAVQCAESAMLFAQLLNKIYGANKFYDSSMLNTVYIGLGHVFVGVGHANTRGVTESGRIIHDAQPPISLRSFADLFNRGGRKVGAVLAAKFKGISERVRKGEVTSEAFQTTLLNEVVIHASRENFIRNAQEISAAYFKRVLENSPHFKFPKAVANLGEIFDSVERNALSLAEDADKRIQLIAQLETAKEDWLLTFDNYEHRDQKATYEEFFGEFAMHAPAFIGSIDQVLILLKSL